jgi:hypothetical protein
MKKRIVIAAASSLVLLAACGRPPGEDGAASGGRPDDVVVHTPSPGEPIAGSGKAKLVTPQLDAGLVRPSNWEKVVTKDPNTLEVFYWGGVAPCSVLDHVKVDYGEARVAVTLFEGSDLDAGRVVCPEMAVYKKVVVQLDEPLDGRRIVDGSKRLLK